MGMIGNAPAAGIIGTGNIQDGGVETADLKDGAVTSAKLSSTAITDKLGYTPVSPIGNITGTAGGLSGGDGVFHAYLYNGSSSADLNAFNGEGLTSTELISTGSTNRPNGNGAPSGHFLQLTDAGGTDLKSQLYYENTGKRLWSRLQWGLNTWKDWVPVFQPGTVLQVVNGMDSAYTTVTSNTWTNVFNFPTITRTVAGSKFIIIVHVNLGFTASLTNADSDNYALNLGVGGSPLNISSRAGYLSNGAANGFTGSDVPLTGGGTYGSTYDSTYKSVIYDHTPSGAVGTSFQYNLYASNIAGGGTVYYNRSASSVTSGGVSTVMIMEVLV